MRRKIVVGEIVPNRTNEAKSEDRSRFDRIDVPAAGAADAGATLEQRYPLSVPKLGSNEVAGELADIEFFGNNQQMRRQQNQR